MLNVHPAGDITNKERKAMIDNQQVGRNMMLLRLQKGLSQQGLAELCNVTHQAVSKWETGAALPDIQTVLFLSKYFGVSMEEMLSGDISLEAEESPDQAAVLPAATETEEALPAAKAPSAREGEAPKMTWEQIMNLVPFASRETLETLVENCVETLDEEKICNLAPFLSSQYLDQLVKRLKHTSPDLVFKLAPFLPKKTVDFLILGKE